VTESHPPIEHDPAAPAAPPRELTATVRRRAWFDRRVRLAWVMALALVVIATWYVVSRYYVWRQEAQLVKTGDKVEGEVMGWETNFDAPKGKVVQPEVMVDVQYTYKGQTYRPHGVLAGRTTPSLTRQKVPIIVDPADPNRWTARTEPGSLGQELVAPALLVPFIAVLLIVAVLRRQRVLRTYREGEAVEAEVVAVGQSPAAPLSRLVKCAVGGEWGGRVVQVLLPSAQAPAVGETLWLITPPGRLDRAIPAALFE